MNPLILSIVGTWVRAVLLIVSGWLIQRHIVTATQGEQLSAMLFDQAINALPGIAALVWSHIQKRSSRVMLLTSLTMPVGTTENDVKDKIKSGAVTPALNTPPDTIPGVPKP